MTSALEIARDYVGRGWNPVPVQFRGKIPLGDAWEKRVINFDNAASYFNSDPLNVGVLMGTTSQGLTDVDLDCVEALAIAPYLLPPTSTMFGRASRPISHWLYQTNLADQIDKAELKFVGPDQKTLLELRIGGGGKGAQTVFPGSTHESGEPIAWEGSAKEPAKIDGELLQRRVQLIAVGCLVVRAWPGKGGRHSAALTLGSFLARAELSETEIVLVIEAIARAAGDEEWKDRLRAVKDAAKHVAATDQGAGLPKLAELVGDKSARLIAGWLNYTERRWTHQGYTSSTSTQPQPAPQPVTPPAPQSGPPWPELAPQALHGISGEIVEAISPQTESDPVALLLQFLTYFGNAIGRGPYFLVEGDKHFTNLFAILVGESSKARKGTSAGRVRQFFEVADAEWVNTRMQGGLSSGEGLIWAVRDPIVKTNKKGEQETEDPGVADKRFLVDEREFFQALSTMKRENNPISRVVREAYDGRWILASLTKHSPARATGALISIVGHITEQELRQHLDHTSMANGYANRFLFACVRRARFLPDGGALDINVVQQLGVRIGRALHKAHSIEQVIRTDAARTAWAAVYRSLSEGRPGLLGAIIGRAEAQVTRLSMLYALLDGQNKIDVAHLKAALAVWGYCEASALHIFGDTVGDPVADAILSCLRSQRPNGLSRTDISSMLFNRNCNSARINVALSTLLTAGKVRFERKTTGGRNSETWFAV